MAAPYATFRCLLRPWGRSVPFRQAAAVSIRFYGVRVAATGELVTHTGQVYDEKDYRRVRFVGRQKELEDCLPETNLPTLTTRLRVIDDYLETTVHII